jgi:hypothetical protein
MQAKVLTADEARRIAVNIARPGLLGKSRIFHGAGLHFVRSRGVPATLWQLSLWYPVIATTAFG